MCINAIQEQRMAAFPVGWGSLTFRHSDADRDAILLSGVADGAAG